MSPTRHGSPSIAARGTAAAAAFACLVCLLLGAERAAADHGEAASDREPSRAKLQRTLGDEVRVRDDGLYKVDVGDGEPVLTHGPDGSQTTAASSIGRRLRSTAAERQPVCADGASQHVIYAHLTGAADRVGEVAGEIRSVMRQMNWILNDAALASGGGTADYRVRCDPTGAILVSPVAVPGPSLEEVVAAVRARGLGGSASDNDYTIFLDAPAGSSCGIASYSSDDRLAADNRNNEGGDFALVYETCWEPEAVMHEVGHNQGAVQPGAPNSTGTGGHCNQEIDVLCYAPDGGDRNQSTVMSCADRLSFDCGYDDYFDAAPEPGEYLQTHWNLGSALNRFVSFGPRPTQQAPKPPGPTEGVAEGPEAKQPPARSTPQRVRRLKRRARGRIEAGRKLTYYRIRVPRRARKLKIVLRGGERGFGLSLRRKRRPTASARACGVQRDHRKQVCKVRRPRRGKWMIAVIAPAEASEGASSKYRLRARVKRRKKR